MKKTIIIIVAVAVLGVMAIYLAPAADKPNDLADASKNTMIDETSTTTTEKSITEQSTTAPLALKDGSYSGVIASNRFGDVQVSITVSNSAIIDVKCLKMPDGDIKSSQISDYAEQKLIDATLAGQNADIDTISGATYTTDSYKESLQSAIDLAKL